jgi:hypothetical protein
VKKKATRRTQGGPTQLLTLTLPHSIPSLYQTHRTRPSEHQLYSLQCLTSNPNTFRHPGRTPVLPCLLAGPISPLHYLNTPTVYLYLYPLPVNLLYLPEPTGSLESTNRRRHAHRPPKLAV